MPKLITLLLPEKSDLETNQVQAVCVQKGITVKRLGKYWIREEELAHQQLAVYGNQAFSMVLAQIYNLTLISPDDTLITQLDTHWTKRTVWQTTIQQLQAEDFPVFIKPVIPKIFTAGVFKSITDFKNNIPGINEAEEILVSEIIHDLQAEARAWIMNGTIKDIALYEGDADLNVATKFLTQFIGQHKELLPSVVVTDLGYSAQKGWFVLEFNACWGAGLNNCRAENIIDCIIAATVNL
jgi:hypothetical protein